MRLILKRAQELRNQQTSFTIHFKIELTDEEKNLSHRYGIPIRGVWADDGINDAHITNAFRPDGTSWAEADVFKAMALEKRLRDACSGVQTYWAVAQTYGGDETVEFDVVHL